MTVNPELRRNLWLQLSAYRLVAMPVVLAIVFGLTVATTHGNPRSVAAVASWGIGLLGLIWGTRRAAEAIAEEVNGGTWDSQRMSSLGAWTMTWGKLLGSTVYPWYGTIICLAVYAVARTEEDSVPAVAADVGLGVLSALLGQVVAMGAGLTMCRRHGTGRGVRWAAAQSAGALAGIVAATQSGVLHGGGSGPVAWYGLVVPARLFWLVVLGLIFGWALLGAYRLMRQELLYRAYPWAWIGFVLFCMALVGGLSYGEEGLGLDGWRWSYVLTGVALTYLSLFAEPKTMVRYRLLLSATRAGDWRRALSSIPLWLPAYLLSVAAAAAVLIVRPGDLWTPLLTSQISMLVGRIGLMMPLAILGLLLFALRDIALVLALNFGPRRERADVAAFIYLAIAYGPLAWLAKLTNLPWLLAFFLPLPSPDWMVTFGPVLLEIVLVAIFLWQRWQRYAVPRLPGGAPLPAGLTAGAAE